MDHVRDGMAGFVLAITVKPGVKSQDMRKRRAPAA